MFQTILDVRSWNDRSETGSMNDVTSNGGPTVFAFESNERDTMLLKCAAAACNVSYSVQAFSEVEGAKDFLVGHRVVRSGQGLPEPALVLLDCSLAEGPSIELLQWMRGVPAHASLVGVVFGPDEKGGIVERCYHAGANFFLAKPANYERLKQVLMKLDHCLNLLPACFESLVHMPEYREARKGYTTAGISHR